MFYMNRKKLVLIAAAAVTACGLVVPAADAAPTFGDLINSSYKEAPAEFLGCNKGHPWPWCPPSPGKCS